jgi:hypothetical protein
MATSDANRLCGPGDQPNESTTLTVAPTDWMLARVPVTVSAQAVERMAEVIAHPPEPNEALKAGLFEAQ